MPALHFPLLLLVGCAAGAVLSPSPSVPLPIELSATNINSAATYWFNFQTAVPLASGSYLYIQFPSEYTSLSASACSLVFNYKQPTATTSACTVFPSYPQTRITFLAAIAAGTIFTVQLTDVQNPTYPTTTGPFKVWTKVAQDSQFTSQNMMFGTLAFTALLPTSSSLSAYINATAVGFSSTVGALVKYTFNVNWDYWIDAGAWFRVKLPSGWTKATGIDSLCTVSNFTSAQQPPSGVFFCETSGQFVYLKGLNASITPSNPTKSSFSLVIPAITNPPSARTEASVQFQIDLMELGTTNILQQLQAYNPAITAGSLQALQVNTLSYLAKPMNGNQLVHTFTFGIAHAVPTGGKIELKMSQSSSFYEDTSKALSCAIVSGLIDPTGGTAKCACASQTLTINGFATIAASKTVVLQAVVKIAATDSEILTVTTFDEYQNPVDSASVVMSRNYTEVLFPSFTDADITFIGGVGTTAGQITFRMASTLQLNPGSTIYITLPPGFSTPSPTCSFNIGAASVSLTSCAYVISTGMLSLITATHIVPIYVPLTSYGYFTIGNVVFPNVRSSYQTVYEFCMTTFVLGTLMTYNHGCAQKYLVEVPVAGLALARDSAELGLYQVYKLTFQTPVSITYSSTQTPQVRVYFPTTDGLANPGFGVSMGVTGNPYCSVAGSNNAVTCQVVPAAMQANGVKATLVVSYLNNLATIATVSVRTVLQSPQTAGNYAHIIEIGYLQNRIWNVIGSNALAPVAYAYASFATAWVPLLTLVSSSQIVLQPTVFTLTLTQGVAVVLGNPWAVNVLFPTTWDISTATGATINNANCATFEVMTNSYAPIIRCYSDSAATQMGAAATMVINGLKNPSSAISFTSGIQVFYAGAGVGQKIGSTATLSSITQATLVLASITPDTLERSAKGVHYTFTFTTVNPIPAGGAVTLQFPSQFSGLMTDYQCKFGAGFVANTGSTLSCVLNSQTITISPLALTPSSTSLTIQIRRLNNPSISSLFPFFITTLSPTASIDRTSSLTPLAVSLPTPFSSGHVYFNTLSLEPNTAGAQYADFFMSFKCQHRVPEGATVQITIPFDFVDIATTGCSVNVMMTSCTAAGHYVNFVTGQDIDSVAVIYVQVNQAFTVPLAQTALFGVMVSFGGSTIDKSQTNISLTGANSFTPSAAASSMTVTSIDFFPNNQGEPATYAFSFAIPVQVLSSYSLVIWFPSDFDPSVNTRNSRMDCWGDPVEFVGSLLSCQVDTFRKVVVSGLLTIPANFQFSVAIGGVLNPVTGKIGQFRFAVQNSSGQTLNYQVNSGNFAIGKGPTPMKFKMLTYANNQLRALNTLTFTFSPASNIPSSDDQGQVLIDLPDEFPLMNIGDQTGWQLPCQTWLLVNDVVNATNWNDKVKCTNYNSNRIVVTGGKAYTALPTQNIAIRIEQLPGPQLGVAVRLIKVMTYDGVKKTLLDRNYGQLSYIDSYSLTLQGEPLTVNNNAPITVLPGTCSPPFSLTSPSPMRVDLQLTGLMPRVLTARLSPTNVLTFHTSLSQVQTCIAVPVSLTPGTYNLQWAKTGDEYSLSSDNQSIYSPLTVTSVIVTSGKASISLGEITGVPAGGHSLPVVISLSQTPFNELIITPTQVGTMDPGVTFDPASLQFTTGVGKIYFYIRANTNILRSSYEIEWVLDGTDSDAYTQPSNSVIKVTGSDEVLPEVSQARYTATRTSAEVFVIGSKPGTFYYQLELEGTKMPTASELQLAISQGQALSTVYSSYGPELSIPLTSLAAETSYILFLTMEDTSGRLAPVKFLSIRTNDDYSSVKFVIDFSASASVTRDQATIKSVLEPEVAKALSVTSQRIAMYNIGMDSVYGRRLAGNEAIDAGLYSSNALVVMLANDKYMEMASPVELAGNLSIPALNAFLGRHGLNVASKSAAITLTNDIPHWNSIGNVWEVGGTTITCAGSLHSPGYIHMVVLDFGSSHPTSQQIAWGLDAANNPTRHAFVAYDGQSVFASVTYAGLQANTRYDVYVTATNGYPGNNKAVSTDMRTYLGVLTATADACVGRCPLYYVADEDWAVRQGWQLAALVLALGL